MTNLSPTYRHFFRLCLAMFACLPYTALPFQENTWEQAQAKKSAELSFLYFDSYPFIYKDKKGILTGVEADILEEFKKFVLKEHGITLNTKWKRSLDFYNFYQDIKNAPENSLGVSSASITDSRKGEVSFSPAYIPDIEVLVTSADFPSYTSLDTFKMEIAKARAVTVQNTTFEANIKNIKIQYLPEINWDYAENDDEMARIVASSKGRWGYMHISAYFLALKAGRGIKRQQFFQVEREGYAVVMPKGSSWTKPINEFFASPGFPLLVNKIIRKHLGDAVTDLIGQVAKPEANSAAIREEMSGMEVQLLTMEKQMQSMQLERQAAKSEKQDLQRNGLLAVLLLVSGLILMLYNRYKIKNKANHALKTKNLEISLKNAEIESINHKMTDSILYAKRIQDSILPDHAVLGASLQGMFVLFHPRDIISGDFYWFHKKEDCLIWALADCTGHGVPGAFMTMLGASLLNNIVVENNITAPHDILRELDERVQETLASGSAEGKANDGMDIAVCRLTYKNNVLEYAGAHSPAYFVRGGSIEKLAPNKFSVGFNKYQKDKGFSINFSTELQKGDTLYLSSDGFQDQFGGTEKTTGKYMSKRFRTLLSELTPMRMEDQKQKLEKEFLEWKGNNQQTDDVLVIGCRF